MRYAFVQDNSFWLEKITVDLPSERVKGVISSALVSKLKQLNAMETEIMAWVN